MRIKNGSPWLHGSLDPSEWPPEIPQAYRSAPYGDRRQELTFIGRYLKEAQLRKRLERALVTDAEFQIGSSRWAKWPNPFRDPGPVPEENQRTNKMSKRAVAQKKPASAKRSTAQNRPVQRKPA